MAKQPPIWKLWLLRWLALYPTLLTIYWLFHQQLEVMPLPVRVLITSCLGTLALSFLWMPMLTRIFSVWLTANSKEPQ